MDKNEFISSKKVAHITSEILLEIINREGTSVQNVANQLPHSYEYVRSRLNGVKGNYTLYQEIAVSVGKSKEWYRQLNIDICEYVLNHDKQTFIEKFGTKRFNESGMKMIM